MRKEGLGKSANPLLHHNMIRLAIDAWELPHTYRMIIFNYLIAWSDAGRDQSQAAGKYRAGGVVCIANKNFK
jgi:hypothetical protein